MKLIKNIIIIIEDKRIMKSPKFLELIDNYGDIYIKNKKNYEKIIHNSKIKETIILITYKELLYELANIKNKTNNKMKHFFEKGLDKNTNLEANISMIIKNYSNTSITHLETYDFSFKDKNGNIYYDIPYYHEDIPEGFSVFCTDEEHKLVLEYLNKKRNKTKVKNKINDIKKEDIFSAPEPTKKNYICHLCRVLFNNYKNHINSEKHKQMILENKNCYKELSETFKRIVHDNNDIISDNIEKRLESLKHKEIEPYYNLRNKNSNWFKKYYDDYIILNDINMIMKNDKELPSTAYNSFRNSSINFEENKFKKEF